MACTGRAGNGPNRFSESARLSWRKPEHGGGRAGWETAGWQPRAAARNSCQGCGNTRNLCVCGGGSYMCVCEREGGLTLGFILWELSTLSFEILSSHWPGTLQPLSPRAPLVSASPAFRSQVAITMPDFFAWILRIELRLLCMSSKHFTNQTSLPRDTYTCAVHARTWIDDELRAIAYFHWLGLFLNHILSAVRRGRMTSIRFQKSFGVS